MRLTNSTVSVGEWWIEQGAIDRPGTRYLSTTSWCSSEAQREDSDVARLQVAISGQRRAAAHSTL
eukprot:11207790-Lingulodinium_polyedra.AAC.1